LKGGNPTPWPLPATASSIITTASPISTMAGSCWASIAPPASKNGSVALVESSLPCVPMNNSRAIVPPLLQLRDELKVVGISDSVDVLRSRCEELAAVSPSGAPDRRGGDSADRSVFGTFGSDFRLPELTLPGLLEHREYRNPILLARELRASLEGASSGLPVTWHMEWECLVQE